MDDTTIDAMPVDLPAGYRGVYKALTAKEALISAPAAYPTIQLENASLIAQGILLAFPGVVFSNIGEPHLIDAVSGIDKVVVSYPVVVSMSK